MVTGLDEEGMLQQQVTPPLHAVTNPEEKRKIIGDTFIKVADEALVELDLQANEIFLAQGKSVQYTLQLVILMIKKNILLIVGITIFS